MFPRIDFQQYPFVRISLLLSLGIFFQYLWVNNLSYFLAGAVIISCIVASLILRNTYQNRWLAGGLFSVALVLTGILIAQSSFYSPEIKSEFNSYKTGIIKSIPRESEKSISFYLQLIYPIDSANASHDELALVYVRKDSAKNFMYGDSISFYGSITALKNNGNPYEFDYAGYLARRKIFRQAFLSDGDYRHMKLKNESSLMRSVQALQQKVVRAYRKFGIRNQNLAVLSALTIGNKDYLTDETRNYFASSGAMHILAVSGLHVGIIYMLINYLLFFLNGTKWLKAVKTILVVFALILYAMITGLSPSVQRAVIMFSVIALGKLAGKRNNIYNNLGVAAFISIALNPYVIFEVGFQLSYAAVLAIVYFYKRIYNLLYLENRVLDYAWKLTCVGICAQIGTGPLAIYYFHQFPLYFAITNLVVIPMATIILVTTFLSLAALAVPALAKFLFALLNGELSFLNSSVSFVESLPNSSIQINLFFSQVLILIAIIFLFNRFSLIRRPAILTFGLCSVLILAASDLYLQLSKKDKAYFVVYNSGNNPVYNLASSNLNVVIVEDTGSIDNLGYMAGNFWKRIGAPDVNVYFSIDSFYSKEFIYQPPLLCFRNKTILIMNGKTPLSALDSLRLNPDLIVIGRESFNKSSATNSKAQKIILDSSVKYNESTSISEDKSIDQIKLHYVKRDGAFVTKIPR